MRRPTPAGWLRIACFLALVGLGLMMWSLLDPRAEPVLVALTLGQGLGTLSLTLHVRVMARLSRAQARERGHVALLQWGSARHLDAGRP
jgi:hypothetical protein